jgi:hypothetical protein
MNSHKKDNLFSYSLISLLVLAIILAGWYFIISRSSQVITLVTGQEESEVVDYQASKANVDALIGMFKVNYFENPLFTSLKSFVEPFSKIPGSGNANLFNFPEEVSATSTP